MSALSSFSRIKSILYYVAAISVLSFFGYDFLTDYLASNEAKNPKTFTLEQIQNKDPKDLPKFFILSNVIRKNQNTVESTLEVGRSKTKMSTTELFPVYVPSPNDSALTLESKEKAFVFVEQPKSTDTTNFNLNDFLKAESYKVKNTNSKITSEERNIFVESGVNVSENAFKLTKGYEIPSSNQLWYAIGCFLGAIVVFFLLIKSFAQPSA